MFSNWFLFTFTKYGIYSWPFIDIWNQVELQDIWQPGRLPACLTEIRKTSIKSKEENTMGITIVFVYSASEYKEAECDVKSDFPPDLSGL